MQDFCRNPDDFLLCFESFELVNINPGHQPVKLPPGKISDLRLLSGPLIAAADRQPLIDQDKAVPFLSEYSDKNRMDSASIINVWITGGFNGPGILPK